MPTTPPSPFNAPFARLQHNGTVSTPEADKSIELSPVIGENDVNSSGRAKESDSDLSGSEESKRQQLGEKLRRVLVLVILSLLIFFNASADSIVGPFLPIEVCVIF